MKPIFFRFVFAPAALAGAFVAHAAVAETMLDIPFSFNVAGHLCPSGTYAVEASRVGSFVTLRSRDKAESFTWSVNPGDPAPADRRVILSFDQQGAAHTLRAIQFGHVVTASLEGRHRAAEKTTPSATPGQ